MGLLGMFIAGVIGTAIGAALNETRHAEVAAVREKTAYLPNPQQSKIDFYDEYRALEGKLRRVMERNNISYPKGKSSITVLIDGLDKVINGGERLDKESRETLNFMYKHLRSVRHTRNQLAHDEKRWEDIPDPDKTCTQFIRTMNKWVDENEQVVKGALDIGKSGKRISN